MAHVEPREVALDDFPHSQASAPGMQVIDADATPRWARVALARPYAEKSGQALRLQVIVPPGASELPDDSPVRFPTVLYVQGSAWFDQQLGLEMGGLCEFARRGYVVAIVEYRPSPVAPFPAQVRDARTAIRFLRDWADTYRVDTERMALWGDSSGGHTTLMVWATGHDPAFSDEPLDGAPQLRCFVDFYGPTNIATMNEEPSTQDHLSAHSPEGMLIGGVRVDENPDLVEPTVVAHHLDASRHLAPLLVVHGSRDRLVPFAQSATLVEAAQRTGQDVTFVQLRGADHGGPAFWTPQVQDLVDGFLRQHLG